MKQYILIMGDEDGNPIKWLLDNDIKDIGQLMEDYGVTKWLDKLPDNNDPNYWEMGWAMLLEVEIKTPKPKTVVKEWEL